MKALAVALFLTVGLQASAAQVFECVDGSRFFRIHELDSGELRGYSKGFAYRPGKPDPLHETVRYNCRRTPRQGRQRFECTRGDYIARIYQARGERSRVSYELTGDFGPFDSGYLHSIYCDR